MLNAHPEILCHYELFHPKKIFHSLPKDVTDARSVDISFRNKTPDKFLEFIWRTTGKAKAVGFKMFPEHNDAVLSETLRDEKVRKILLDRENPLFAYTSLLIAQKTGQYSLLEEKDRKSCRVSVKWDQFLRYCRRKNEFYENAKANARGAAFPIYYEDLLERRWQERLLEFLGVDSDVTNIKIKRRKQNPSKLTERIVNFDEVCERAKGTEFESYIV